jgi:hypothetical protein
VSQLGSGTTNYYFMREFGWSADRSQGEAFTPNPAIEYFAPLSPASTDVHQISAQTGSDTVDASLPARGGYNYQIYLPPLFSGYVQVYNAVFGPDNAATHNNCDNVKNWPSCSSGGNYYYHEEDSVNFSDKTTFDAMEYTLFNVNNVFVRSSDTELSKFTVLPIDATNWAAGGTKEYLNVNTGKTIDQTYKVSGAPKNMSIYHNWVNVTNYDGSKDVDASGNGLVINQTKYALPLTGAVTTGTNYRLRVDSLSYDGTNPPGGGVAHKGYAVRVVDALGNLCATCTVSSWDDMASTPRSPRLAGGRFRSLSSSCRRPTPATPSTSTSTTRETSPAAATWTSTSSPPSTGPRPPPAQLPGRLLPLRRHLRRRPSPTWARPSGLRHRRSSAPPPRRASAPQPAGPCSTTATGSRC